MKKLLLIEDDKFLVKFFGYKLKKLGYSIILLEDGFNALKVVKKEKPNLIMLDLLLPKKNGFEVLSELKKTKEVKSIPVIVVSRLGMKSDIEKVLKLGATKYLVKSESTFNDIARAVRENA